MDEIAEFICKEWSEVRTSAPRAFGRQGADARAC